MRGRFPDFASLYADPAWVRIAQSATVVEASGYGRWPRAREIVELCRRLGHGRVGLAHCADTLVEAELACRYLHASGLEAVLPPEAGCDPQGQARFFEDRRTELNVICGMCPGHDAVFARRSAVPVISLLVRDLKLQHNPAAALYTSDSYFRGRLYNDHLRSADAREGDSPDDGALDQAARAVVEEGQGRWCRIEEIIELARRLGATRLGMAFCIGLRAEARSLRRVLNANGFTVKSVCCKTGSVRKEVLGISESQKVRPGQPEMICNPIAQAELLNRERVQLVLLVGQCAGHDSATMAHLEAPAVQVVAKDRALGHNTAGALYAFAGQTRP
jgi:uncharacterized metal-binding protein